MVAGRSGLGISPGSVGVSETAAMHIIDRKGHRLRAHLVQSWTCSGVRESYAPADARASAVSDDWTIEGLPEEIARAEALGFIRTPH
jgi:hypothetical protein